MCSGPNMFMLSTCFNCWNLNLKKQIMNSIFWKHNVLFHPKNYPSFMITYVVKFGCRDCLGWKAYFVNLFLLYILLGNFLMSFSKWRNWKKDLVHNWERVKRPNYRKLASTCAMPCTNTATDWTRQEIHWNPWDTNKNRM